MSLKQKRSTLGGVGLLVGLCLASAVNAEVPVVQYSHGTLDFGGMIQLLGFGQRVDDPYKNNERVYLFLKEARLRASGNYDDFRFHLEIALGGEDTVAAPNPGVTLGLLDFSADIPLHALGKTYLKVGQFKVPYGRERLAYSGYSQFVDRSVQDLGFKVGRDVGVTLNLCPGPFTVVAGIFTGGGRDIPPEHYLPQNLGVPLLVARAGIGSVDDDPYELHQNELDARKVKSAFFVNGLYTKDSAVGHSTALNVKLADKSVLLDSTWNPYIGKAPLQQGTWWQYGGDAAVRVPLGAFIFSGEAELNYGGYSNDKGSLHMFGGRAQGGVLLNRLELALRYSFLLPTGNYSNSGTAIMGDRPIHEVTPAVTYYFHGHNLKLVADLPLLFNAPLFNEKGVGSYVGTELPAEAALLAKAGNSVTHSTVIEGRLMFQALF